MRVTIITEVKFISVGGTGYLGRNLALFYKNKYKVFIGARNLFGEEPPVAYDAFAQNFDFAWDIPGGAFIYGGFKVSL